MSVNPFGTRAWRMEVPGPEKKQKSDENQLSAKLVERAVEQELAQRVKGTHVVHPSYE